MAVNTFECSMRLVVCRWFTRVDFYLVEAVVVDPRVPRVFDLELFVRNEDAARVRVLARQLVVFGNELEQLFAKVHHLEAIKQSSLSKWRR